MKIKLLMSSVFLLISGNIFAGEYIRCSVSGRTATAYYCNTSGGGSKSGTFHIYSYDNESGKTESSLCVGVAVVVNGCEKLCSVSVSSGIDSCDAY